jgi:hypothetical protein
MHKMIDTISQEELLIQLTQLQSENAYLRTLVAEYKYIAGTKETEWRELSLKTVNNIPLQSNFENQLTEISLLQTHIRELQQKIEGGLMRETALNRQFGTVDNYVYKNDDLKSQLNSLQCELAELKEQLQRVYHQNAVLQNYVSRIAELESLLSIAEEEIDRLNNLHR